MEFPILKTKRLELVEITDKHLADLYNLFSDEDVIRFYNLGKYTQLSDAQKFVDWYRSRYNEGLAIRWGIKLKGNTDIIGTAGFNNYTTLHRANIGYDLQKSYWNKGYITEALKAVIHFGFYSLEINRIEAEVMQGNVSSERVLEKLGFTKEGILRQWMLWNNSYYDMSMYSLLKSEYSG
ncbi:MAG TPA: N-acetyltransferase [Dysgonomonas sp.]|nr:N-acetyltransferase [Dysgonomonas sp.]